VFWWAQWTHPILRISQALIIEMTFKPSGMGIWPQKVMLWPTRHLACRLCMLASPLPHNKHSPLSLLLTHMHMSYQIKPHLQNLRHVPKIAFGQLCGLCTYRNIRKCQYQYRTWAYNKVVWGWPHISDSVCQKSDNSWPFDMDIQANQKIVKVKNVLIAHTNSSKVSIMNNYDRKVVVSQKNHILGCFGPFSTTAGQPSVVLFISTKMSYATKPHLQTLDMSQRLFSLTWA
jgi:hypothetical protein